MESRSDPVVAEAFPVTEPIDTFMVAAARGKFTTEEIDTKFTQLCEELHKDPEVVQGYISSLARYGVFEDNLLVCIPEDMRAVIGL